MKPVPGRPDPSLTERTRPRRNRVQPGDGLLFTIALVTAIFIAVLLLGTHTQGAHP